jgi:hypothetical protein
MVLPGLGPEWKPEKAKFVLLAGPDRKDLLNVMVDPSFPDAWTKPPFLAGIKGWVTDGATLGRYALVHVGRRLTAVLSDRMIDLGTVKPQFFLMRERDPAGRITNLRVKPDP